MADGLSDIAPRFFYGIKRFILKSNSSLSAKMN